MKKINLMLGLVLAGATGLAAADSLYVDADGRVGVGSNVPDSSLTVVGLPTTVGVGNAVVKLTKDGGLAFQLDDTSNNVPGENSFWNFANANGETEFRISRSGTPTEMTVFSNGDLLVRGDIMSGGTTVVPDYVFAPGYKLLSLDEVKAFIAKEKHLPNIPSASEYAESGNINVSELQMRMLEKVEELTLYTIAQQEKIDQLEASLAELKK